MRLPTIFFRLGLLLGCDLRRLDVLHIPGRLVIIGFGRVWPVGRRGREASFAELRFDVFLEKKEREGF